MKVYFVTAGKKEEVEVIRQLRPKALLCSYWYFKNRPMAQFIEQLGYKPEIMLDSGAYSAYTQGKNISLFDYMDYIKKNAEQISSYIALDVIGDVYTTQMYYAIMCAKGFHPIPVYHYGEHLESLYLYKANGEKVIALGNTVPVKDKAKVAEWCVALRERFPGLRFHLLGSSSSKVLKCGALASCDSSAWYLQAVNGKPRHIPGKTRTSKLERAFFNMKKIMEENDENIFIYNLDCGG